MRIKCKKRLTDYEPVKGNEKKIINHLLEHNYYDNILYYKNKNRISAKKFKQRGNIFSDSKIEKNRSTIYTMNFNNIENEILNLNAEDYFKLNDDGSITASKEQPSFREYIAIPVDGGDEAILEMFKAPNFMSFERDGTVNLLFKNWSLKTTTETFAVTYQDIIIFDADWKIVDCLMNRQNKKYESLLACNDYMVERED